MRAEAGFSRRGFTLVELLVVTALIATLAALLVSAVSAVRDNGKIANTANAIARLDQVIMNQFRRYEWQSVPTATITAAVATTGSGKSAARGWHIRRNMISADMPDRWSDVVYMATTGSTEGFPKTAAQAAYVATYKSGSATISTKFGGAECLFMIVMQGGFADCLDCNGLAQITKGDKDGDGAPEFWDDWNNPIDYILWAPGFQRTAGSDNFFGTLDTAFPGSGPVRPGLGMRPLIYSAGPDGRYGLNRDSESDDPKSPTDTTTRTYNANLTRGKDCGNPLVSGSAGMPMAPPAGGGDRTDNIVNVELTTGS